MPNRLAASTSPFGPARHHASDRAYAYHYVPECTCMRYDGSPHAVP